MMTMTTPSTQHILKTAKKRFQIAEEYWAAHKAKTTDILKFIAGEQWTDQARKSYENAGFAAMTSNRLPTFLRQITNELRKNPPAIQVDPHTDGEAEKAEVINDLIRGIQEWSDAESAYVKAGEQAAATGIGYFRLITKYKTDATFDQVICIEPIADVNAVMLDPNHVGLCGEDAEYAFISTVMSRDEYLRKYGTSKLSRFIMGTETEQDLKDATWSAGKDNRWNSKDQVLIAEYYYKDVKEETLCQVRLESGAVVVLKKAEVPESAEVIQERQVDTPIVKWAKLNDVEVLEESEWPGKFIPVVAVKGDEYWLENKRRLVGAVEPAIEAQVQLNYAMSWRGQLLQMAPKAPYIGTADQFKTYEDQWANINVSNQAFIPYNLDSGAPPPARDLGEVPIQAAGALIQGAQQDLLQIFGTFDPSKQTVAPESGKAILARQEQSYNSNYHFYDNLARSVQHAGRIIVDAIPVIYDTAREVELLGQDGKKKHVAINQPNEAGVVEYDLTSIGNYTVAIETGPTFGTKRQESANAIMDLIGVYPAAAPAIADLAVRQMDWPGATKIADSMEALVPPQVLQARQVDSKNAAAMVPGLQAQLAQANQKIQALAQEHQLMVEKLNDKATDLQIKQLEAGIDQQKVTNEAAYRRKELELKEQVTELEYLLKLKELEMEQQRIQMAKDELAMKGVKMSADMLTSHHDKTLDHIENVIVAEPGTGETHLSGLPDLGQTLSHREFE